MNDATKSLIAAALNLAETLTWDITDNGYAVVRCDYDLATELAEAADAYRSDQGLPADENAERQKAIRGLAELVRE